MQDPRNEAQDPEADVDEDVGTTALLDTDRRRWDLQQRQTALNVSEREKTYEDGEEVQLHSREKLISERGP